MIQITERVDIVDKDRRKQNLSGHTMNVVIRGTEEDRCKAEPVLDYVTLTQGDNQVCMSYQMASDLVTLLDHIPRP